jgi:acyl-CoA hydrolase
MNARTDLDTIDTAIDLILARGGTRISVATPLGLGKPNHLLNALYRRVKADPARHLTLYTALSLDLPEAGSELERRFLGPFLERQFGADYPRLEYVADLHADRLPANVHVEEFYFQSGAMMDSHQAQRAYASANYTHVARDLAERAGLHAIVQLVAVRGEGGDARYSLSCNPDLTLDALEAIAARGGRRPLMIGVVHPDLPWLRGAAEVQASFFDALVDGARPHQPLFALPRNPVDLADHAIGLHASTLVRDGGTLQIGIGALSDAIVNALLARHRSNADYRAAISALRGTAAGPSPDEADAGAFRLGLFGASEMVMDGFMHLRRAGILVRRVHEDIGIERALARGEAVDPARLRGGHYLKGAFALGSKPFYDWLRGLEGDELDGLAMCAVSDINQLYGEHEELDRLQRRDARFFNTCMIATLLGAAASDALEDGRVVSGVGGQYNFVAMAHELAGARSVLLLRATRRNGRRLESNIRWRYGHATIPRHLRDVYITEYGIADLRGRSDEACIRAMLAISDARFVEGLAEEAKRAGKLARDFRIPDDWRRNTPEDLAARLRGASVADLLPRFPFGSDFDATELRLLGALSWLKGRIARPAQWPRLLAGVVAPGEAANDAALDRLGLSRPRGLRERLLARLVRAALARTRARAVNSAR